MFPRPGDPFYRAFFMHCEVNGQDQQDFGDPRTPFHIQGRRTPSLSKYQPSSRPQHVSRLQDGVCAVCRVNFTNQQFELLANTRCDHDLCKGCYHKYYRHQQKGCGENRCLVVLDPDAFTENFRDNSGRPQSRPYNTHVYQQAYPQNAIGNQIPSSTFQPQSQFGSSPYVTQPGINHGVAYLDYYHPQAQWHQPPHPQQQYQHYQHTQQPNYSPSTPPNPWASGTSHRELAGMLRDPRNDYRTPSRSSSGSNVSDSQYPRSNNQWGEHFTNANRNFEWRSTGYQPLSRRSTVPASFYDRGRGC